MDEKVIITKSSMDAIGDAIRDRNGLLTKYLPSEMPAAIESIPNSYTLADEGKVVKNGALIAQTARVAAITENGTYDTTENNSVTINVSGGGGAVVQPLSVTENGTYNPPSGVDGYAPVTVNVSGGEVEATAAVQNDAVVVDGCTIVSQPAIVGGKMSATSTLGLQIAPTYLNNVCLEFDYQYTTGPSGIVFSLGGSNTQGGVLVLTDTQFQFYANGAWINRTDLNIDFDQERHVKIIATKNGELYVVVDDTLVLSASHNYVRNIVDYCATEGAIAVGWNQSAHSEYNSGTFNNVKISFNVDLPNT